MGLNEIIKEEIEKRAYDIFEYRREYNIPGDDKSDYFQAEKEILAWYNPNQSEHIQQFKTHIIT